jgi:hypothetical protein
MKQIRAINRSAHGAVPTSTSLNGWEADIENPRVGGSIPPLGTTFTNKNNDLAERNAR